MTPFPPPACGRKDEALLVSLSLALRQALRNFGRLGNLRLSGHQEFEFQTQDAHRPNVLVSMLPTPVQGVVRYDLADHALQLQARP